MIRISLYCGERFAGESIPRIEESIERFDLVGPHGTTSIQGISGNDVSFARPEVEGQHTIVYQSKAYTSEFTPDAFESYVLEEKLDSVLDTLEPLGERGRTVRETYYRCSKSIINVDDTTQHPHDTAIGLPLEIVVSDFCGRDSRVRATILFENEPVEGLRVVAARAGDPARLYESVTDSNGQVELIATGTGPFILTSLHMVRAPQSGSQQADWVSYWSSLTFGADALHTETTATDEHHNLR
ncbi:MAG: DUF4198 domain-containing protein [Phycisphaerales bacterium]